eukprot:SAG11_NODE_10704_length_811_cov_0.977528_1_plen_199_part_10
MLFVATTTAATAAAIAQLHTAAGHAVATPVTDSDQSQQQQAAAPADRRFAWIAAIESGAQDATYELNAQTYYIDRQYLLPNGTQLVGAGSGEAGGTRVVAVATRPAQKGGHFHGCGLNHVNRIGFVLGSRCRIANLHYTGIERARYPDSHPMCGGAPFQTPGCATPYCTNGQNSSWLTMGGAPVRDSIVEDITIAGGTT